MTRYTVNQSVKDRDRGGMSTEKLRVTVTDNDYDGDELVGNTMLSKWDIVSVTIYFILVMAAGFYVSIGLLPPLPLFGRRRCFLVLLEVPIMTVGFRSVSNTQVLGTMGGIMFTLSAESLCCQNTVHPAHFVGGSTWGIATPSWELGDLIDRGSRILILLSVV